MSALIPRATIDQIVGWRDCAIELYTEAFDLIAIADAKVKEAHAAVAAATPGSDRFTYSQAEEVKAFHAAVTMPEKDRYLRVARRLTDTTVWGYIIERTELERLMDAEAKRQLREQMQYVPERVDYRTKAIINQDEIDRGLPPVTVENVQATLERFAGDADDIWRRGVANAFAKLDRRFRSHDGWKVGSRVILSYFCDSSGWFSRDRHDVLLDIERAFLVLDGKTVMASYAGCMGQVEHERRGQYKARQSEHDTTYFKIRIFKNGNAHLWMKRDDLVRKVNKILGEWYGDAIGDHENVPTDEDVLNNPKTAVAKNYGFFPTPPEAAAEVVAMADIYRRDDGAPLTILAPSAGTGNLARRAAEQRVAWGGRGRDEVKWRPLVDCVELHADRVQGLRLGPYRRVIHSDFLHVQPDAARLYDRIVMNPPFDRERDIDHVVHALKFLAPDGILVSIMSAGTEFRETKKSIAFRTLVEERGGWFKDLPERSFAEVGTNVNTILCVIGKRKRW